MENSKIVHLDPYNGCIYTINIVLVNTLLTADVFFMFSRDHSIMVVLWLESEVKCVFLIDLKTRYKFPEYVTL